MNRAATEKRNAINAFTSKSSSASLITAWLEPKKRAAKLSKTIPLSEPFRPAATAVGAVVAAAVAAVVAAVVADAVEMSTPL